jgi:hypothetical protein
MMKKIDKQSKFLKHVRADQKAQKELEQKAEEEAEQKASEEAEQKALETMIENQTHSQNVPRYNTDNLRTIMTRKSS